MGKKVISIETLIAVFGKEDPAPIQVTVNKKQVTFTRDGDELKAAGTSIDGLSKPGGYALVLDAEGKATITAATPTEKKVKQYPAFDTL